MALSPHQISWRVVSCSDSLLDTAAAMSKGRQYQQATSNAEGGDSKEGIAGRETQSLFLTGKILHTNGCLLVLHLGFIVRRRPPDLAKDGLEGAQNHLFISSDPVSSLRRPLEEVNKNSQPKGCGGELFRRR